MQRIFGTGRDVFCEMKRMVAASDRSRCCPYLTQSRSVNIRTVPLRGRILLRTAITESVKCRLKVLPLIGLEDWTLQFCTWDIVKIWIYKQNVTLTKGTVYGRPWPRPVLMKMSRWEHRPKHLKNALHVTPSLASHEPRASAELPGGDGSASWYNSRYVRTQ